MKVLAELTVLPLGIGTSLSKYVAACEDVLRAAGLEPELHGMGTNVEGEWDAVTVALKACHQKLHAMGAPRVYTVVKMGTRTDRDASMADKVSSVEDKLGKSG